MIVREVGNVPAAFLPQIINAAGERVAKSFFEFFTVPIRNSHTRQAYYHAAKSFMDWCASEGIGLLEVEPLHVAAYIEGHPGSLPTKKQHLSALRMLFAWMVKEGSMRGNPAREVRTEKFSRAEGKTAALSIEEIQQLFASFNPEILIDLRDRAFIGVMAFTFARVEAVTKLKVEHYVQHGRRALIRLGEKGGKERDIPCHHQLEAYLDSYIEKAQIESQKSFPLFRSFKGRSGQLSSASITRTDAHCMIKRRLRKAALDSIYSCHSFRASGITTFLENGGSLEMAQYIAGHADSRTTKLYDRRWHRATLADIERIRY